jgi:peroxiredoxin
VELRQALDAVDDLEILYVLASNQVNEKTLRFVDAMGLRDRVRFAVDLDSQVIDGLGIRNLSPEPIEAGVPHPATYLVDRDGVVRFADVRVDFQIWLDPETVLAVLDGTP